MFILTLSAICVECQNIYVKCNSLKNSEISNLTNLERTAANKKCEEVCNTRIITQ